MYFLYISYHNIFKVGHSLENDAGSQLENEDTATSSVMVRNSKYSESFWYHSDVPERRYVSCKNE